MSGNVLILSDDAVFARMLEIELSMHGRSPIVSNDPAVGADADVVLWDLDSIRLDAGAFAGMHIVGFTGHGTVSALDPDRICSIILHRPFEMRMLREELELLMQEESSRKHTRESSSISLEGQVLTYQGKRVTLGPAESRVMRLLIEAQGEPVSREAIAQVIGESATNKTEVYVCYLRRKLAAVTDRNPISTVRGIGYRFQS